MQNYNNVVMDRNGNVISYATITVTDYPGGATSTVYAADVVGANINPLTTNNDGEYEFYAVPGVYTITTSKSGIVTEAKVVTLGAASESYLPPGTGAVSRSVQSKLRDIVSAADFATLQAAVDSGNKAIFLPAGSYAPCVVSDDNINLYGAGVGNTFIITASLTGHGVKFYPNDTTATSVFLNNCGISDVTIYSGANKTAGAGVYALQCNGFRLNNVQIQNHPEGLLVSGGQLNVFNDLTVYASAAVLTGTPVSASQAIRLCEAPIDGGLYQNCFTCEFTNTITALSRCIDKAIRIESADGLHFTNGYITGAYSDEVYIACVTANRYIAGVVFNSIYLDGVSMSTAPTNRNGINIPASALGTVYDITFNSGLIGNYTGKGCVVGEGMQQLTFSGGTKFVNIDNFAVDFVGDNTTSEVTITGCHFRDVGEVTVSTGGVRLSTFLNAIVTSNTFTGIGNTGAVALTLTGTNANVSVLSNTYSGCTTNVTNSATFTGKVEGVAVTFTPAFTFTTPGDVSITYSFRDARWTRYGNHVDVQIEMTTSGFTHTTASGNLTISALPAALTSSGARWMGTMQWNGITKANYTQFAPYMLSGGTSLTVSASGSAQALSTVAAADMPTGGSIILNLNIRYECAA